MAWQPYLSAAGAIVLCALAIELFRTKSQLRSLRTQLAHSERGDSAIRAMGSGYMGKSTVVDVVVVPSDVPRPIKCSHLDIMAINDVYNIFPLSDDEGGLASVATYAANMHRAGCEGVLVHAGDYLSPSALGTAVVDGSPLAGMHMVAVMNALHEASGFEFLVTLGNHEFDLNEDQFRRALNASQFTIVSSNVFQKNGSAFPNVVPRVIKTVEHDGRTYRAVFIAVTLQMSVPYALILDPVATAKAEVRRLLSEGGTDLVVLISHNPVSTDFEMAQISGIDLIIGGHEHDKHVIIMGPKVAPIFKAVSNARTLFHHKTYFGAHRAEVRTTERYMKTNKYPKHYGVHSVALTEMERAFLALERDGFQPHDVISGECVALEGKEAAVRSRSTTLTNLIGMCLLNITKAHIAIFNSGAVRIDEDLKTCGLTQFHVLSMLPFQNNVTTFFLPSQSALSAVLEKNKANRGEGSYLQVVTSLESSIMEEGGRLPRGALVVVNDYLSLGLDKSWEDLHAFFSEANKRKHFGDFRQLIIRCMQNKGS